jgi:hypothetical protein
VITLVVWDFPWKCERGLAKIPLIVHFCFVWMFVFVISISTKFGFKLGLTKRTPSENFGGIPVDTLISLTQCRNI